VRKLADKEIEEKKILVDSNSYSSLCRKTKEVKEIKIRDLEDAKKAAALLETYKWVATYAVSNKDHVIMVFNRIV